MRKFLTLAGGWSLVIVGGLIASLPFPLPFPVGITMLLGGCAILTAHSKTFRRWLQQRRHRNAWLSRGMEMVTKRAPARIKAMVEATRPHAQKRHDRMRARHSD